MPFSIDISPLRGGKCLKNPLEIRRNTQAKHQNVLVATWVIYRIVD